MTKTVICKKDQDEGKNSNHGWTRIHTDETSLLICPPLS
jgi:hypothetical protein